jgi:hypothetical protein
MEKDGHGLEFVMTAHTRDQRFIELMAMITSYHCGGHQLALSRWWGVDRLRACQGIEGAGGAWITLRWAGRWRQ